MLNIIELPDSSYGEWILYYNEEPTFHIDCFRKNSRSDMIIKGLLSSPEFSIPSIISKINQAKNLDLRLGEIPILSIRIKSKVVNIDLKPLPDEWLDIFDYSVVPPWVSFPGIEIYDMFWRMGKGEDHLMRFWEYYEFLSEAKQKEYRLKYPPPEEWTNFYQN